ncbi:MAG: hypothetical protein ACR2J1_11540 [Methyloceanibacter sp.]
MTLKHELLLVGFLLAATLGTVHAMERGDISLASLAQKVLPRG